MKYFLPLIAILASAFILSACSLGTSRTDPTPSAPPPAPSPTPSPISQSQTTANPVVAIKTKSGQIVVRLYSDQAPKTVANFLAKVKANFYKGLTFHRVEPGFVVQGGDPKGNGTGGGTIRSEINSIPFKKGSVGLARGPVKENSNDSQFFICLATESCQHLTNEYVNFGEVISGLEVVGQIQVGDRIVEIGDSTK